jgi:hypothetical protein
MESRYNTHASFAEIAQAMGDLVKYVLETLSNCFFLQFSTLHCTVYLAIVHAVEQQMLLHIECTGVCMLTVLQ